MRRWWRLLLFSFAVNTEVTQAVIYDELIEILKEELKDLQDGELTQAELDAGEMKEKELRRRDEDLRNYAAFSGMD